MSDPTMIAPHSACRYAIIINATTMDDRLGDDGYSVVAVHAVTPDKMLLISQAIPSTPPKIIGMRWIDHSRVLAFAPRSQDAWAIRRAMMEDDRKAGR